jgi:transporter family-2 protein
VSPLSLTDESIIHNEIYHSYLSLINITGTLGLTLNNLSIYILLTFSLIIGFSLISQSGVNAQLRMALNSPVQAAFISFFMGTIVLGIVAFSQGGTWFQPGAMAKLPWWAWLGGVLGAFNIAMATFLAPKLGAMVLAISVVSGQIIASIALDQNGWLGYPKIDITLNRIVGAVLVIIGLFMVVKK